MSIIRVLCVLVVASVGCGTTEPKLAGDPGLSGDSRAGGDSFGDPAAGDPVAGDAVAGDAVAGDAVAGDAVAGDPFAGDSFAGDPSAGDPALITPCGVVMPPVVVQNATVLELYTAINAAETLTVVDVREPGETAGGIIEGALLYPWNGGVLQTDYAELPTDVPLYIVCASGNRSGQAAQFLVNNGFTCVHSVAGGMGAWNGASYPTVSP